MTYSIKKNCKQLKTTISQNQKEEDIFFSFEFLSALEESDCLDADSGWTPNYLVHETDTVIPFYEKENSHGEFVFDYAWANAYFRYGQRYYPKLVMSVPFTPVDGNRIFSKSNKDGMSALNSLVDYTRQNDFSSLHALFVAKEQRDIFSSQEFIERNDCNFIWKNQSYSDFDDFLEALSSRHRKNIKKERKYINSLGIEFEIVKNIKKEDWDDFYLFYALTYVKRGQKPYLNENFFLKLSSLKPQIIFAHKGGYRIAAALFFNNKDTLYGRYWGAKEEINYLHFEMCYYQGIELAIKQKNQNFDPGIQGHHKLKRGFEPIINTSFHWIKNSEFRKAIRKFCDEESKNIFQYFEQSKKYLPFKNAGI